MMSNMLVPGDLIVVPSQCLAPVDILLVHGSAITNEAMLTGESVPVIKLECPDSREDIYGPDDTQKHTIYAGTDIIQT